MKNNKSMACFVVALVACSAIFSSAARKDEVTLIMVPREDATVRLGMDLANKYPTLLISYKLGANEAVSLHGWTGTQWVNVGMEDFQAGNFFRTGPDSALIVEKAGAAVPGKMLPPVDWCASVAKITTTEMRPLLHLVGQYYDFSFKDWQWFSKRYNMEVDAINPEGLNIAWYHRRMGEHLTPRDSQGVSDLQYWVFIRQPMAVEAAAPGEVEAEEAPLMGEESGNPLTNDAPAAVIMGAADADEEVSEAPAPADETEVEDKVPENQEAPAAAAETEVEDKAPENQEEM